MTTGTFCPRPTASDGIITLVGLRRAPQREACARACAAARLGSDVSARATSRRWRADERERDVHVAAMDEYHEHFAQEYRFRAIEHARLQQLCRDVVWYNFETYARSWRFPWPESEPWSTLQLQGQRYTLVQSRGRRKCEKAEFPVYFDGHHRDAPHLPPLIVLNELRDSLNAMHEAEEMCGAPYEWAPGGRLYEKMLRESDGVRTYRALSSDQHTDDGGQSSEEGVGLQLGDRLERSSEAHTEATADLVLGRVRGDRSVVSA